MSRTARVSHPLGLAEGHRVIVDALREPGAAAAAAADTTWAITATLLAA